MTFQHLFSSLRGKMALPLVAACVMTACSPEEPTNEVENKLHGDPYRATLTLEAGIVNDGLFSPTDDVPAGHLTKRKQTIVFQLQPHGWQPLSTHDTALYVLTGESYRLSIRYADAKGNDITGQFCTNGQDKIHQHFFRIRNPRPLLGSVLTANDQALSGNVPYKNDSIVPLYLAYHYADTEPWNATPLNDGSNIVGENPKDNTLINPLGFNGWLCSLVGERAMVLQIDLLHARTSKYKDGIASPYYQPTKGQISGDHWDVKMRIPLFSFSSLDKENEYVRSIQ